MAGWADTVRSSRRQADEQGEPRCVSNRFRSTNCPSETRAMMEEGTATGMYTTVVPMQIIAYSTAAMTAMHRNYEATFRKGVLEPRLVELLRLHSAQTAMCAPCSTSRKDDCITDDDVACLMSPDSAQFDASRVRGARVLRSARRRPSRDRRRHVPVARRGVHHSRDHRDGLPLLVVPRRTSPDACHRGVRRDGRRLDRRAGHRVRAGRRRPLARRRRDGMT